MPARKAFLLRIDPAVLESLQHWADDELRSLNGQIEYVLRRALRDRGRAADEPEPSPTAVAPAPAAEDPRAAAARPGETPTPPTDPR